jgi:hypothetical protein
MLNFRHDGYGLMSEVGTADDQAELEIRVSLNRAKQRIVDPVI